MMVVMETGMAMVGVLLLGGLGFLGLILRAAWETRRDRKELHRENERRAADLMEQRRRRA